MTVPPPQIVSLPADYSIARYGRPIMICCHDTEGVDSRTTLQHGDNRGVSVHALIQKFPRHNKTTDVAPGLPKRTSGVVIYRMVPDERGANHAGFSTWTHNGVTYSQNPGHINVNAISLSFELECLGKSDPTDHYTDDQLLAAGWQIQTWRQKYGPLPLVRHATIDPGRRFDTFGLSVAQIEQWCNAASLLYGVGIPPATMRLYELISPCIPLTARAPDSPLADIAAFAPGDIVQGEHTPVNGWLWVSDKPTTKPGIGFVPSSYARPV